MIRIGLDSNEKQSVLNAYLKDHPNIRKVFVLYWPEFRSDYRVPYGVELEEVAWKDIIEYPVFYRLLEEIDNNCLIIVDELLRTQNRSELTYNCAHHYCNQTEHKIVFEHFPFIERDVDFMILLDFLNKGKYKGKGFVYDYLRDEDVRIKETPISFRVEHVPITDKQRRQYATQKGKLFANLGLKDPDTIPRNLHVYVGNWKKPYIRPDMYYIARNSRFKLDNVATYQRPDLPDRRNALFEISDHAIYVLDFAHRRLDFNDYLKYTKADNVVFVSTGLPVDNYYESEFRAWLERKSQFLSRSLPYGKECRAC